MEKAEWKKEIDALLSSGTITDSDIEDYISKHPEIRGRDVWYYISELTAPEECKGCVHIQMSGIYPCNVCKRRNTVRLLQRKCSLTQQSINFTFSREWTRCEARTDISTFQGEHRKSPSGRTEFGIAGAVFCCLRMWKQQNRMVPSL